MRSQIDKILVASWGLFFLLVLAMYLCSGCATIVHGQHQDISVSSNPEGADVWIDARQQHIITPGIVSLRRDRSHSLVFQKEGYADEFISLDQELSGWAFGNLLLTPIGAIVGAGVDVSDGAIFKLSDDNVHIILRQVP